MWSIALYYILDVLKNISIDTSYNYISYGMALVVSSLIAFWVYRNIYLAISHTLSIKSGAYYSA
jgi:hypothetical protein